MSSQKRLFRNPAAGRIAGVCAGIADYLDTDVTLVRLAWVVLSIVPGGFVGGLVAYIAAWAIMPDVSVPAGVDAGARRLSRSKVDRKIGGVCGGLAEYLGADSTVVRLIWAVLTVVPGAIVMGVVAYLVAWFIMPGSPAPLATIAPSVPSVS
jgi:phage shock protein C